MDKTIIFLGMTVLFLTISELVSKEMHIDISFMNRQYTDRLRGIAAMLVVISHVSGLTGTRVATPLGGIGVALFLICSGYGMYQSYIKKGMKDFWKGKFKRILLPYWIAVILFYIINSNQCAFNVETIAKNVLLINPIPYLWFVQYLMICNVVFWCVFLFVPERIRIPIIFLISLTVLLFVKNDMYAEQGFSFMAGLVLGKYEKSNQVEKNEAFKIGSIFFAVSVISLGIKQFPEVRSAFYVVMNIVQMFIKLFGACGILLIVWRIGAIWNKAFITIGKCSYELYITHTLMIPYLANMGVNIATMLIYLVSCGVGVIALHWMLKKFDVAKQR